MKLFLPLHFLFFTSTTIAQNLIPDPSAEDVAECPSSLGNIDIYTASWINFRGSPDYWNSCSTNIGLGWNNSLGYQVPRTGEGYLGTALHHTGLSNAREYFGTILAQPLEIGESYNVSFYTSLAYKITGGTRTACNNLGVKLMTQNYLSMDEQGPLPNSSLFVLDEIIVDTTNWVFVDYTFIADSAYNMIVFGNFYDDASTEFVFPFTIHNSSIAYYYFDDFCLRKDGTECDGIVYADTGIFNKPAKIWPNPATSVLNYENIPTRASIRIMDSSGKVMFETFSPNAQGQLTLSLKPGVYLIQFNTEKEVLTKRFIIL